MVSKLSSTPKHWELQLCLGIACALLLTNVNAAPVEPDKTAVTRDGSHDFDFEIGEWTTHLVRLAHPLAGSKEWLTYDGTSIVRSAQGGHANLVDLSVQGPFGRIDGVSLRLYEPQSHQWTLNFANMTDGRLTIPMVGRFHDGRGEFYAQDSFNGRAILVRFTISDISAHSCRFEQAFSADGGRTWEVNWIATDTRRQA
jgi:hypothetical protein